jgi:hypothetical protein
MLWLPLLRTILARDFSPVCQTLRQTHEFSSKLGFILWAFGALLFTHVASFISAPYFDQSFVFLYLTLAVIGSMRSATVKSVPKNLLVLRGNHPITHKSCHPFFQPDVPLC